MTTPAEKFFFEVFESLPRQGPGNLACTQRALDACELGPCPRIIDLGCGAGAQTRHLAHLTKGPMVAIDNHAPFIDQLQAKLEAEGLSERVDAHVASMDALQPPSIPFDLVWSEGALYNLGLERALPLCAALLRPGGYLAFTDAVWRSDKAPEEVRQAFADYATMGTVSDVLQQLERHGWSVVTHFDLPDEAWWDDFYTPMEARIQQLTSQYSETPEALAVLDQLAQEPEMHRRHGSHYGYTFFVAKRA